MIDPADINVLIGCETSGTMREAFLARGFNAFSCDILPPDRPSNRHIRDDIRHLMQDPFWDLLCVMHPPCTRLCNSGVRWLHVPPRGRSLDHMWAELDEGAALFSACWNAPIPLRAVENPVMHKHAKARIENYCPPAQTVQPWWFGDRAFKATSFYLHGLPPLTATNRLTPPKSGTEDHKRWSAIHRASPGPDRWKIRSATFPGIAAAAAEQWGRTAIQRNAAGRSLDGQHWNEVPRGPLEGDAPCQP
ncbi:hypothetical protein [Palleronia caenipelagi]|uniref:hypothetical protein n=1 Tax=Palleronia caenipelagi TaxID=2489174 RepID=UPI001FEA9140|nr:hypothetical protein [Palleronia caenipelagi]